MGPFQLASHSRGTKLPRDALGQETQKAYFILNGNLPPVWLAAKALFWATAHVWSPASKLQHDYEALWSYFYIWRGFLCAQVSCETTEWRRIAIFSAKPQIHVRIAIDSHREPPLANTPRWRWDMGRGDPGGGKERELGARVCHRCGEEGGATN